MANHRLHRTAHPRRVRRPVRRNGGVRNRNLRSIGLVQIALILASCSTYSPVSSGHPNEHAWIPVTNGIVETWETALIELGSGARASLGIVDPHSDCDITERLKTYGIRFDMQWRAVWNAQLGRVVVTNYPDELCKIRGLVSLCDNGFSIQKK
jgi:hypothetical protein